MTPTPLLFLHGALGSGEQFRSCFKEAIPDHWHFPDLQGHGKRSKDGFPASLESMADDLEMWISQQGWTEVNVFGYSMGGYVALLLASRERNPIRNITTLGTKMEWSPEIAARETSRLNPEIMEQKIPAFAERLAVLHGSAWKDVVRQTAGWLEHLGATSPLNPASFARVQIPVRVCLGSKDNMVGEAESRSAAASMPSAQFTLLEDEPHVLEQVQETSLRKLVSDY
jgi:pimeloyl-ACP methyl ester carboxylesterase